MREQTDKIKVEIEEKLTNNLLEEYKTSYFDNYSTFVNKILKPHVERFDVPDPAYYEKLQVVKMDLIRNKMVVKLLKSIPEGSRVPVEDIFKYKECEVTFVRIAIGVIEESFSDVRKSCFLHDQYDFLEDNKNDYRKLFCIYKNIEDKLSGLVNTEIGKDLQQGPYDKEKTFENRVYSLLPWNEQVPNELWSVFESHCFERFNKVALLKLEEFFGEKNEKVEQDFLTFVEGFALKRWYGLKKGAKQDIQRGKLELKLWNSLGSKEYTRWLPNSGVDRDVYIICNGYAIRRESTTEFSNGTQAGRTREMGDVCKIELNCADHFGTKLCKGFPFDTHSKVTGLDKTESFDYLSHEFQIYSKDPFKQIKLDQRLKWRQKQVPFDDLQARTLDSYPFYFDNNKSRHLLGYIEYVPSSATEQGDEDNEDDCGYFRPVSRWAKDGDNKSLKLNVPFLNDDKTSPLFNQHLIHRHKHAKVILTPWLPEAHYLSDKISSEYIWSSWYGGIDNIENVSWGKLKEKVVYYLIRMDDRLTDRVSEYSTAFNVWKELKQYPRIKLQFLEAVTTFKDSAKTKIECSDVKVFSTRQFYEKAIEVLKIETEYEEIGLHQGTNSGFKLRSYNDIKNVKDRDFLLAPIMHEGSITLLYAGTSVGKTWLSLALAHTVAIGGRIFHTWHCKRPQNVLYIDTEMDTASFKNRLRIIRTLKLGVSPQDAAKRGENLSFILKEDNFFGLQVDEFLEAVKNIVLEKKISLIVLDNLSTFTRHNDSAAAWEVFNIWLNSIQKNKAKGKLGGIHHCSVLVVHHSNKKNVQRGSSAKTNTVDNVISLTAPESDDALSNDDVDIAMVVNIEKGRDLYGFIKEPFEVHWQLNEESAELKLKDEPLSQKERKQFTRDLENRLLIQLFKRGKTYDYVEKYMGWARAKVAERKKDLIEDKLLPQKTRSHFPKEILDDFISGSTYQDLANKYNSTLEKIRDKLRRMLDAVTIHDLNEHMSLDEIAELFEFKVSTLQKRLDSYRQKNKE